MQRRGKAEPMQCERCGQTHQRCTGHKRGGDPCGNWPIRGHDKCRMHAGKKTAPLIQRRNAVEAVATYGLPAEVDPHDALRDEVWRSAGHVHWLQREVNNLEASDIRQWDEGPGGSGHWSPAVLIDLYQRERAHHVKVCKTAIDAGLSEREVRLAEQQGQLVVDIMRRTFEDPELGLSDAQRQKAVKVGARHLRAIEGGAP